VQPHAETRQFPSAFDRVLARWRSCHQACGGQNAVLVRFFDRFVHGQRETEVIGGHDEFSQNVAPRLKLVIDE
jgi:hypothetical protein